MINFLFGDARFFWNESLELVSQVPSSWDSSLNTGLGIPALNTMWITSYLHLSIFLGNLLHLSWQNTNFLFWILPALINSFISAYILYNSIFPKKKLFGFLAGFIYLSNSYFLMIFLGGQQGVALAYSIIPYVIWGFLKLYSNTNIYRTLVFSLIAAWQILFDPRIFFLTVIILGLFSVIAFDLKKIKKIVLVLPIILIVIIVVHSFWIIPLLIFKFSNIAQIYGISPTVEFFSFAKLEDSISLLHPNFPENIFGKVYFLKSEFLFIPIIAFSSLLFLYKEKYQSKLYVIFFSIVALVGAFLAKGTNEPFGNVYKYLFDNIPGFSLFRDPTKFYMLICLGYSMLIPYTLYKLAEKVRKKKKLSYIYIFIIFGAFWFIIMRYISEIKMHPQRVPEGYIDLKNFITSQDTYFRTLWIPQLVRYGYFSNENPAIGRFEFLNSTKPLDMIDELKKNEIENLIQEAAIKYIVIPEDPHGEIFTNDRKYDHSLYQKTVSEISRISYLTKVKTFGNNVIYEVKNPMDHFYSKNENIELNSSMISPTEYLIEIRNAKIGDRIVFSESFDRNWKIQYSDKFTVTSQKYKIFNSFVLSNNGNYYVKVFYEPQRFVIGGLVISSVTFLILLFLLFHIRKRMSNY